MCQFASTEARRVASKGLKFAPHHQTNALLMRCERDHMLTNVALGLAGLVDDDAIATQSAKAQGGADDQCAPSLFAVHFKLTTKLRGVDMNTCSSPPHTSLSERRGPITNLHSRHT